MAVLLIQNGADVDIRNNSSETATSVAKSSQMKELLEVTLMPLSTGSL